MGWVGLDFLKIGIIIKIKKNMKVLKYFIFSVYNFLYYNILYVVMSKVRVIFIIAMIFLQIYSSQSFVSASQYDQPATELDWMKKCLLVQPALYKSCNEYVDDNGVLTTEGERAVVCIRDGAIIGLGSSKFGLPPVLVFPGLDMLTEMKGCDGIVNFQVLNTLDLPFILKLLNNNDDN